MAAQAYHSAFKAASVPLTHESIWGKVFTGLADVAVNSLVAATVALPGGAAVDAVATGLATTAAGAVVPDMNAAISNAFTTTTSGPAPLTQSAPAVINPTYAATNLLGLLLSNAGVQEEINSAMSVTSPPSPLWANYSIYTGNTGSPCSNIQVTNNLLQGSCPEASGSTNTNPNDGTSPPSGGYTNVYASSQTTAQLSIWDAILTGSDVVNNGGYIEIGDNAGGIPSFSPPVQLINATNGPLVPSTTPLPTGESVNTTFNLNTGTLTAQSISNYGSPETKVAYRPPVATPSVTVVVSGSNPTGAFYSPAEASYDKHTGVYSLPSYYNTVGEYNATFANGSPQTINMSKCIPNSSIVLTITPDASNLTGGQASGVLSCGFPPTILNNITLAYQNCVNDPWASGGVLAAVTTPSSSTDGTGGAVILACACVPGYLDGAKTTQSDIASSNLLGGVVVGATSANPGQTCPSPST